MSEIYRLIIYRANGPLELSSYENTIFRKVYQSKASYSKKGAQDVYIELTGWPSSGHIKAVNTRDRELDIMVNTVMTSENGWDNTLSQTLKDHQTIEFGVRSIKMKHKDRFVKRRKAFMAIIHENQGAEFDHELKSLDGEYNIMLFAWSSFDRFKQGAKTSFSSLKAMLAMIRYFPLMKQKAFQVGIQINED
ncbi:hypothetical protein EZV73_19070 [Acidaminobacter sp. JC074]|uniref:hypothetical protein n=1 Tax=Acidaminobacter sp. JC074 TaxID=2530199 RepID=UPI001F0EA130|nr:hypothetical protein [Acidaminobacter sp. JC074]MCH4889692.1 hypothetical protein [Acidaminobacter sp. JC074]